MEDSDYGKMLSRCWIENPDYGKGILSLDAEKRILITEKGFLSLDAVY